MPTMEDKHNTPNPKSLLERPRQITATYTKTSPQPNFITQEEGNNAFECNATTQQDYNNQHSITFITPRTPNGINTLALKHVTSTWHILPLLHQANGIIHPVTKEKITKYEKLANDPITQTTWQEAICKELGRLVQGYDDTPGMNTFFFISPDEIKMIPCNRSVTYARIVMDY
jgi:hypothetical protein